MARGPALSEVMVNGKTVRPALTPTHSIIKDEALSPRSRTLSGGWPRKAGWVVCVCVCGGPGEAAGASCTREDAA